MKAINIFSALLIGSSIALSSCGLGTAANALTGNKSGNSFLGGMLGSMAGQQQNNALTNVQAAQQTVQGVASPLTSINGNSLISGIIGMLTNGAATETSLVGNWTYTEPTVQFESESLLAQAGGSIAASTMVSKFQPYYEKVGLTPGKVTAQFNEDKTCQIAFGTYNITGTYEYDNNTHMVTVKNKLGIKVISAYVTLSGNQLALTLDSTKLLTIATAMGAASGNANLKTLSSLAGSFNGMKSGFLFVRQ